MKASDDMNRYFDSLQAGVDECHKIALQARRQGYDPEKTVDIKLAKNMAERVEGLISSVAPQLTGTGFSKRIIELEQEYSPLAWRVALKLAEEVAKEKFCKFKDKKEAMEVGIRAGFTYQTGGIVSAPLEGFVELRIKKTRNGDDYLAPTYAGPIRGAGGTAASFSLLLADYMRTVMGLSKYDPDDNEVNRFKTEIDDYHEKVTNLQYHPSRKEVDYLMRHIPVEVDGEPTEKKEVSNFKDLDRVETNRIRGGVCLVVAEGLSQKAPKLWKRLSIWGKDFNMNWSFLEGFLKLQKSIKAKDQKKQETGLTPNFTYISDLVAGRPVLTHPMRSGGFRLRYGRSRVSGFSAASINPATMVLLNKFIATGTQLKMERPGKAASITPCDTVDGPIVLLEGGSVVRVQTIEKAKRVKDKVEKIIFLGDILFNYGDFSENGHILAPPGYNEEWWTLELEKAFIKSPELISQVHQALLEPHEVGAIESLKLAKAFDIPLSPRFTYFWSLLTIKELEQLSQWFRVGKVYKDEQIEKIVFPLTKEKELLEKAGIPHEVASNEFIIFNSSHGTILFYLLDRMIVDKQRTVLENLSKKVKVMDKAGTFVGARMGRPEKAKMRKLSGSPQVLFPIGEEGGRLRSFQAALETGYVNADFPMYKCEKCKNNTILPLCETCGSKTVKQYLCSKCGLISEPRCEHGPAKTFKEQQIDIKRYFNAALKKVADRVYPDLIKGVRGTMNKNHIPENIVKGILRAKHEIYVNKDGTIRFDMSEVPITHFKPKEVETPLVYLKALGYTHDIYNQALETDEQIVEMKPQDIIMTAAPDALDEQSDKVLARTAHFVDELLVKLYGLKPYYNVKSKLDLVGHLVIGLAPHISAGSVGRIIGFSKTQGMFAHPLFHAAMRRDCDGDEACVMLLMDAMLNFSHQYLPDRRGAKTMDAPLVLTSRLNPSEVDDQAHGLDIVWHYDLDFYEAASKMKNPWDVKVKQIKHVLGTPGQFEGMGFTHDTKDINSGVNCSAYKALPSMEEKLKGQMELAEKIRAVDEADVARLVIEKHFLRDTKGNLRRFSTQQFRCVKCNGKYRRPPLRGKCKCGGRLIFTVSHGSVIKYLEPTISLATKYEVGPYLRQTLDLLQLRVDGVFGRDKEKQEGLGKWFG